MGGMTARPQPRLLARLLALGAMALLCLSGALAQGVLATASPTAARAAPATPPQAPESRTLPREGEAIAREVCLACHGGGVAQAPRVGDRKVWARFEREGQAMFTAHGWVGVRGMPAQGGRADLTLEEFARGTAWMARASGLTWADPDAAMLARIQQEEAKRRAQLARQRGKS